MGSKIIRKGSELAAMVDYAHRWTFSNFNRFDGMRCYRFETPSARDSQFLYMKRGRRYLRAGELVIVRCVDSFKGESGLRFYLFEQVK